MWQWSRKLFKKHKDVIETDFITDDKNTPVISKPENNDTEELKQILEDKIKEYGLKNITLVECPYEAQTWPEMDNSFTEYQKNRVAFLKLLAYEHKNECMKLGLTPDDINMMKHGLAPENYNTHIKIPFDFGGSNELKNLALIKSHPTHDLFHSIIDFQIEHGYLKKNQKILVPYFEERIYHD